MLITLYFPSFFPFLFPNCFERLLNIRIYLLFNQLVNDLEQPDMNGFLTKRGAIRMNWKKRWFILKAHFLFYYKGAKDDTPAGIIGLRGYDVEESSEFGKANLFMIKQSLARRTYYIFAPNPESKFKWMEAIRQSATSIGTEGLDGTCLTPLISILFFDQLKADSLQSQAAVMLEEYFNDHSKDGSIIEYLRKADSFKPIKKLVSVDNNVARPAQTAFINKLADLSLVEEVGKTLIAQGIYFYHVQLFFEL